MNNKLLLDVNEAAATLGLGRSVTYQLIMSGELASLRVGRRRLVPTTALAAFIEGRLRAEAQEAGRP